jgi:hypothetical protein
MTLWSNSMRGLTILITAMLSALGALSLPTPVCAANKIVLQGVRIVDSLSTLEWLASVDTPADPLTFKFSTVESLRAAVLGLSVQYQDQATASPAFQWVKDETANALKLLLWLPRNAVATIRYPDADIKAAVQYQVVGTNTQTQIWPLIEITNGSPWDLVGEDQTIPWEIVLRRLKTTLELPSFPPKRQAIFGGAFGMPTAGLEPEPAKQKQPLAYWVSATDFGDAPEVRPPIRFPMKDNWPERFSGFGPIQFYYSADCDVANAKLIGTYSPPAGTDDQKQTAFGLEIAKPLRDIGPSDPVVFQRLAQAADPIDLAARQGPLWYGYHERFVRADPTGHKVFLFPDGTELTEPEKLVSTLKFVQLGVLLTPRDSAGLKQQSERVGAVLTAIGGEPANSKGLKLKTIACVLERFSVAAKDAESRDAGVQRELFAAVSRGDRTAASRLRDQLRQLGTDRLRWEQEYNDWLKGERGEEPQFQFTTIAQPTSEHCPPMSGTAETGAAPAEGAAALTEGITVQPMDPSEKPDNAPASVTSPANSDAPAAPKGESATTSPTP